MDRIVTWLAAVAVFLAFVHSPAFPAAEGLAGIVLLVVCVRMLRGLRPQGISVPLLILCCLFILGLRSYDGPASIREVIQLVAVMGGAVFAFQAIPADGNRKLAFAVCAGWGLTVTISVVQYAVLTEPARVAGLFGSRALFGVVIAVTAPMAFSVFNRFQISRHARGIYLGLALVIACMAVLYLPALILLLVGIVIWSFLSAGRPVKYWVLCAAVLAAVLILTGKTPRENRSILEQSAASRDVNGTPCRWTVEMRSAVAAVREKPLLGYGPGKYQSVVSSAKFRRNLPSPAENIVEPGTQNGYIVMAVEYGVPAALVFALVLGYAAYSARSLPLALSVLGMGATNLLVQGVGILLAGMLGMSLRRENVGFVSEQPLYRRVWAQACAITVLALLTAVCGAVQWPGRMIPMMLSDHPGTLILVEAQDGSGISGHFSSAADKTASQGRCLTLNMVDNKMLRGSGDGPDYSVTVKEAGTYRTWLRSWWLDGCGNSCALSLNGGMPELVGNDSTYRIWHWVEGPSFNLDAGEQTLRILPLERGIRIDQIALITEKDYVPYGVLDPAYIAAVEYTY
jgi:hypothetical protein